MVRVSTFGRYNSRGSGPHDEVLAYVEGRVFHVTLLDYLPSIIRDGEIQTNKSGELPTGFGYLPNGYFRNRDCVSVFDYRAALTEEIESYRNLCHPIRPAFPPSNGIAFLILSPTTYPKLRPWTDAKKDALPIERYVAHVEAGYPGAIPLSAVTEIVSLQLIEDPKSHAAILRNVLKKRGIR